MYVLNKIIETKLITSGFDQRMLGSLSERQVLEYTIAAAEIAQYEAEQIDKHARK